MNALTDRQLIDRLAVASQTGVRVRLIVRGSCCLLPGILGKTENIEIISIVGRFLEHSRIFCFGAKANMNIYISSADWMTRNTENRVEVACPIFDESIKQKLYAALMIILSDNVKGRRLTVNGNYEKKQSWETQDRFTSVFHAEIYKFRVEMKKSYSL